MSIMDGGSTETNRAGSGLAEIGAMLRRRREEVGQDLATIAATTHIRLNYLKAIEEGRRRDLPGTAYMIGYVRTYADYLGFDGDRLITDYHAQLTEQRRKPEKPQAEAAAAATGAKQLQSRPLIFIAAAVVLMVAVFLLWRHFSSDEPSTETAETPPAETTPPPESTEQADTTATQPAPLAATPSPTGAEASAPSEATPATAPAGTTAEAPATEDQVPPEADVASTSEDVPDDAAAQDEPAAEDAAKAGKVVIRARLESWIQITNAKKETVFSRVLRAGETYTVPEEAGLMLTTGNAGGVEILLDGKKLKSLGTVGLVRRDLPLDPKKLKDGSAFKPQKAVTN